MWLPSTAEVRDHFVGSVTETVYDGDEVEVQILPPYAGAVASLSTEGV